MKTGKTIVGLAVMLLFCGVISAGAVLGQEEGQKDLAAYTCKDIMRLSGNDRDVAIGVFHAYVLGKKGTTTFDVTKLSDATDAFIETCLDNPKDSALTVMENLTK